MATIEEQNLLATRLLLSVGRNAAQLPNEEIKSSDVLAAFRESDLAKSIPEAYAATDVRREVFDVCTPFTQTWALSTVEARHNNEVEADRLLMNGRELF